MAAPGAFNPNLPSVKRILQETRELELEPSDQFRAAPLEDNLFEWHFTVRGPDGTPFEGGRYHGRLLMPADYPFKPPTIMMLTPNGRFEVRKRICLSISDFHPEQWQPAWGVRTIMTALIAFFPSPADGAIGGLDYTAAERERLAVRSAAWHCEMCGERMAAFRSGARQAAAEVRRAAAPADAPAAADAADGGSAGDDLARALDVARDDVEVDRARGARVAAPAAGERSRSEAHTQAPGPSDANACSAPASAAAGASQPMDRLLHHLAILLFATIATLVLNKVLNA